MIDIEEHFSWGDWDKDTCKFEIRCGECDWTTTGSDGNCEDAAYEHWDNTHVGNLGPTVRTKDILKEELAIEIVQECLKAHKKGMGDGYNLAIKTLEAALNAGASIEYAFIAAKAIGDEKFK